MDERKQRILSAIVQDYVSTAEPVGSRTIARKYSLGVSPATIRNEMADLEEMGLIEQPHTSAGRIPSQQGYRYYVDCLMKMYKLSPEEQQLVGNLFRQKVQAMDELIRRTTEILARLTSYASVVCMPQMQKTTFRHIKLIPLEDGRAVLVVITNARYIQHSILEIPGGLGEADLERVAALLNSRLQGRVMEEVLRLTLHDIYQEMAREKELLQRVMAVLAQLVDTGDEGQVYLGGTVNMLKQPEFQEMSRVQDLLALLEESRILRGLINQDGEGLTVRIGGENKLAPLPDLSLVTATYSLDGSVVGTLGILGPTRMDYARVVSLVDFITTGLSQAMGRLG